MFDYFLAVSRTGWRDHIGPLRLGSFCESIRSADTVRLWSFQLYTHFPGCALVNPQWTPNLLPIYQNTLNRWYECSNFKSCKLQEKTKQKTSKCLNLLVKNWKLRFWCSLFHFFMWFERFEIWTPKRLSQASCTLKVTKIN